MHSITLIRTLRGKRLKDLADALALDPSYVSRMVRGEYGISNEVLLKIAELLRVPVELLKADPESLSDLIIAYLDHEYDKTHHAEALATQL